VRAAGLAALIALTPLSAGEPIPEDRGAAGLWQSLKRLQTTARVLYLTAHPDDEDGGTITWLSRGQGIEVTLLSLTRGESGANLVTGDFFDALGALRTVELLRAAHYYGVQVRFSRHIDYGFSKNVAETWRNWKQEEVLADVVRVIRQVRPHVILTRFQGTPRDGHGNHEASGAIGLPAFEAAGDPLRFPGQIAEGLEAWQPLKLYSGNLRESEDWTVRVDSGVWDPVLGRSYAQIAREGLRHQRSQGAGSAIGRPGPAVGFYKLIASRVGMSARESGFLARLALAPPREIRSHAEVARHVFSMTDPTACAPSLAAGLKAARTLSGFDGARKREQFEEALARSLGLEIEALVAPDASPRLVARFRPMETFALATPGQTFHVSVDAHIRSGAEVPLEEVRLLSADGWDIQPAGNGRYRVAVAADTSYTKAFWNRESVRDSVYRLARPDWLGRPLAPPPLVARATFRYADVTAAIEKPVETSFLDATGVQHRRLLAAGPALSVRFASEYGILPLDRDQYPVRLTIRNNGMDAATGEVELRTPPGWSSARLRQPFRLEKERKETNLLFRLTAPAAGSTGEVALEAVARSGGREYRESFLPVSYGNLETVWLASPARHRVRRVDVKVSEGLRVGYVAGTGDDVPEALAMLGVRCDLLDAATLASGDLSSYNAILLGIRAYAARSDVRAHNGRLLEYVRRGGVLIVQYNTQEYDHNYGPYPYTMTAQAEEVSEEDAPVEILDPADPVFQAPNRITPADFDGWIEQRGSKFWKTWDPAYKPLLASHDTGQAPQRGGWLVARHGQGLYVYCAYAWYRQLPFAVPGAYRLFANLVSLGAPGAAWRR